MNRAISGLRHYLCTLSGEDDSIIRICDNRTKLSFSFIGLFVAAIFIGCWVSASAFITELFTGSGKWVSIPIGVVWGALIMNLYLLLLYTISPPLLPRTEKKTKNKKSHQRPFLSRQGITISILIRMAFISLLAIIIAQPLNVLILSGYAEKRLASFKTEYRVNMMVIADSSLIKQEVQNQTEFYHRINTKIHVQDAIIVAQNVQLLNNKVQNDEKFLSVSRKLLDTLNKLNKVSSAVSHKKCDSLRLLLHDLLEEELRSDDAFVSQIDKITFSDIDLQEDFRTYQSNLKKTIEAKITNYHQLNDLLQKSNFYLKRIQILLSKNPLSWLISLSVCVVFLLPVYWKFRERRRKIFYEKKKKIEKDIVQHNYQNFKETYSDVLENKIRELNHQTWQRLDPFLSKIRTVDISRHETLIREIKDELTMDKIIKYEYWADSPFRTQRRSAGKEPPGETELLKTIYSDKS